jgi:hypothetical protein
LDDDDYNEANRRKQKFSSEKPALMIGANGEENVRRQEEENELMGK